MVEQQQSQLLTVREQLDALPPIQLTEGYTARSLYPGDEEVWERNITASFSGEHHFYKETAVNPYGAKVVIGL